MHYTFTINGQPFAVEVEELSDNTSTPALVPTSATYSQHITAPALGIIEQICVSTGQWVDTGQPLLQLNGIELSAPCIALVKQILVSKGASVEANDILMVLCTDTAQTK